MAFKRPGTTASGTGKTKGKFEYRPRTSEEMKKRANQGAGNREGFVIPDVNTFTPADGPNKFRILPPTWDNPDHFGMELWVHYGVGADNNAYLCPSKMKHEPCPICEARAELDRAGDDEGAKALLPKKRVAMFIIDRNKEAEGPKIWAAPWTIDQEIAKQALDESGEALALDNPYEGYDVSFSRDNQGKNVPPKYTGVKAARKPSPIFDDEEETNAVLELISKQPLPECLIYHDYDVMAAAFNGMAPKEGHGDDGGDKKPAGGKPTFGKGKKAEPEQEQEQEAETEGDGDQDLPTWEEVHEMDEDAVTEFAAEAGLDFSGEEFDDLEACQDWVCAQLEIEKPEPKTKPTIGKGKPTIGKGKPTIGKAKEEEAAPAKSAGGSWKDKLKKFSK